MPLEILVDPAHLNLERRMAVRIFLLDVKDHVLFQLGIILRPAMTTGQMLTIPKTC